LRQGAKARGKPLDSGLRRNDEQNMKTSVVKANLDQRRAAARRTAWIVAIIAAVIFLLFFAQALSH